MARLQSQGVRRRVATEGWVVAGFVHRTSREGDPQLHTHCLVPNLAERSGDGRYVGLDAGPVVRVGPGGRVCPPESAAALVVAPVRPKLRRVSRLIVVMTRSRCYAASECSHKILDIAGL